VSGPGEPKGRSLTRREFDAVIRRAAELASTELESEPSLTESELMRIAQEVGLGERHVREALAEVRSHQSPTGLLDRVFGSSLVRAWRVVPGSPEALGVALDEFFVSTQLLQRVRRGPGWLQYRSALDWASQLARAASFGSPKYHLASAKSVEVRLERVDDENALVEILVDPDIRADHVAGAAVGGGLAALAGSVGVVAVVVATGGVLGLALPLGLATGGALGSGVTWLVGQNHRKKSLEVHAEVEGILDRLEARESLEPPPPGWRIWMKRQFKGMARDLMGKEGGR